MPSFSPFNFSRPHKLDLFANYLSPFLSFSKQCWTRPSGEKQAPFLGQDVLSNPRFFVDHKVEGFSQAGAQGQRFSVGASIDMEIVTRELPLPQNAPLWHRVTGGETGKRENKYPQCHRECLMGNLNFLWVVLEMNLYLPKPVETKCCRANLMNKMRKYLKNCFWDSNMLSLVVSQ